MTAHMHYVTVNDQFVDYSATEEHAYALAEAHREICPDADVITGTFAHKLATDPIDAWLRFDADDDEESEAEANTYLDGTGYRIEWCLTAVGLVTRVYLGNYEGVTKWYASNGFTDFTDHTDA